MVCQAELRCREGNPQDCPRVSHKGSLCLMCGNALYAINLVKPFFDAFPPQNPLSEKYEQWKWRDFQGIKRAGSEQIFASLCCLAREAISSFQHRAALTSACLFRTILMPFPEPQMAIPLLSSPLATADAKGCATSGNPCFQPRRSRNP